MITLALAVLTIGFALGFGGGISSGGIGQFGRGTQGGLRGFHRQSQSGV
jgi:hypothetical protein